MIIIGKTQGKVNDGQNTKRGAEKKTTKWHFGELMDILCSKQLITAFYQTKCKVAK